jgi:hypothetical protein
VTSTGSSTGSVPGSLAGSSVRALTGASSPIWTTDTMRWSIDRSYWAMATDCTSRTTCLAGLPGVASTCTSVGRASGPVTTLAARMPGIARRASSSSGSSRSALT